MVQREGAGRGRVTKKSLCWIGFTGDRPEGPLGGKKSSTSPRTRGTRTFRGAARTPAISGRDGRALRPALAQTGAAGEGAFGLTEKGARASCIIWNFFNWGIFRLTRNVQQSNPGILIPYRREAGEQKP